MEYEPDVGMHAWSENPDGYKIFEIDDEYLKPKEGIYLDGLEEKIIDHDDV